MDQHETTQNGAAVGKEEKEKGLPTKRLGREQRTISRGSGGCGEEEHAEGMDCASGKELEGRSRVMEVAALRRLKGVANVMEHWVDNSCRTKKEDNRSTKRKEDSHWRKEEQSTRWRKRQEEDSLVEDCTVGSDQSETGEGGSVERESENGMDETDGVLDEDTKDLEFGNRMGVLHQNG